MHIVHIKQNGKPVLAARRGDDLVDLNKLSPGLGTNLVDILAGNKLAGLADKVAGAGKDAVVSGAYTYLSPVERPPKIICVGLNYADHAKESPYDRPDYPVLFLRVATSLVAHGEPLIAPKCSVEFDYEGEMVAIIGKGGKRCSTKARCATTSSSHRNGPAARTLTAPAASAPISSPPTNCRRAAAA
jgi:acylpyruvate hydrolase